MSFCGIVLKKYFNIIANKAWWYNDCYYSHESSQNYIKAVKLKFKGTQF